MEMMKISASSPHGMDAPDGPINDEITQMNDSFIGTPEPVLAV